VASTARVPGFCRALARVAEAEPSPGRAPPTVDVMANTDPGRDASSQRNPGLPDGSQRRPALLLFDVNETLSDMSALAVRFEEVGAPVHLSATWFAGVLRDGFALTAVDASEPFARIAAETLRTTLQGVSLDRSVGDAVEHIMDGFAGLPVHPDVPDGIRALAGAGIRLVTLSNGAAHVADGLLRRAGLRDHFEALLSVEDAGAWKPAAGAYAFALERCGARPEDVTLVAVHPWDIDGAARAGLGTAWINRTGAPYPGHFRTADHTVTSLMALADVMRKPHG
jgi:2-haloacid dehalogenase